MDETYKNIDEALVPLHDHINGMLGIDGEVYDTGKGMKMRIYEVNIDTPLQLDITMDEYGAIVVGSSPPLYYLETGVMPVFHRMRITAVVEEQPPLTTEDYES